MAPMTNSIRTFAMGCSLLASSCYRYSYHQRNLAEPDTRTAIDTNISYEELRWSYAWGLLGDVPFSPDPRECDGKGAGRVDVVSPWYGVPLTVLSLGTVAPARVIVFCSTDSPPSRGP